MVDNKPNVCSRCGQAKPRAGPDKTWCRDCRNAYQRERHAVSPEVRASERRSSRLKQHRLRWQALQAYGGRCACCGEDRPEFLAIDHIDGGGIAHRKALYKDSGSGIMTWWLRKQGYPPGFRILCHNCNQALGHHGYCPHVTGSHYLEDVNESSL